ncbi:MAG: glycosyltransferase family 4 protein [Acidobacteriia bacterium]|nr:glycosyltransferase family 4 protein [Terriglobia bacterium]
MNILITSIQHYTDRPSGSSRLAYDEARYLAAAGHRVFMLAPSVDAASPEFEQVNGLSLLRYPLRDFHLADPRRAWGHQRAAKDAMRRHIAGGVEVVHGHAPLSYLAACELFGNHARTFYSVHSPVSMEMEISWPRRTLAGRVRRAFGLPLVRRMERQCLVRSTAVTSDSEFTRQQLIRIHGEEVAARVRVFPGWVDLDEFRIIEDRDAAKKSLGWPLDVPVLFTLRRLVPRMGLDRLLRAVRRLRDQGQAMQVIVGGDGPLREELQQLAISLELGDSVRFVGRVPAAELPMMYGACDAFVLPTAELECFGIIALEALACGRPVLATPVAAIPEMLRNFEPRWLARSADENGIADVVAAFVSGKLPAHAPEELRLRVQKLYSHDARLAELAGLVTGGDETETDAGGTSQAAQPAHARRQ